MPYAAHERSMGGNHCWHWMLSTAKASFPSRHILQCIKVLFLHSLFQVSPADLGNSTMLSSTVPAGAWARMRPGRQRFASQTAAGGTACCGGRRRRRGRGSAHDLEGLLEKKIETFLLFFRETKFLTYFPTPHVFTTSAAPPFGMSVHL